MYGAQARAIGGIFCRRVRIERADLVRSAERERERASDETEARDPDLQARTAAAALSRPTARATCGTSDMSAAKFANVSDW